MPETETLCKPNVCLKSLKQLKMTVDFCNFDALKERYDSYVHVDKYVETVDYFFTMPQI